MPRIFFLAFTLLLTSSPAVAQSARSPNHGGTGVFEFSTVAVFMEFQKQTLPVVSAQRRGVFLQTNKGLKRQRYGSKGLIFRPTQARSSVLVRATKIDYELANLAAERRQDTVAGALEQEAHQARDFSDLVNSAPEARQAVILGPGQTVESVNADSADAWEAVDSLSASSSRLSRTFQAADTLFFEYTLVPNQTLQNVTAAVVLRHPLLDNHGNPTGETSTHLSMEKIGDLKANEPRQTKFSISFSERFLAGPRVQVYLFDGDMNPVASNLGGPIREVPASRL